MLTALSSALRRAAQTAAAAARPGLGQRALLGRLLREAAAARPAPDDACYVFNFATPHRPTLLRLPTGRAPALRRDMARLVEELRAGIPAAFEAEAYHLASAAEEASTSIAHVEAAIAARERLGERLRERLREETLRGRLHAKGVLILSGYLAGRHCVDRPLSLSARLVFEQSSGTVGGVNEKIEGWFRLCRDRGLDGQHAVIVPAANRDDLMLDRAVREAAREGRFHVLAVATIDEAIGLLTGLEAGVPGTNGAYPRTSLNGRVEARLLRLAERAGANAVTPTGSGRTRRCVTPRGR